MRMQFVILAAATALLCGCPINYALSPFDATGAYTGTWEMESPDPERPYLCSAELVLEQDLALPFPANHEVRGTLTFNFTCPSVFAAFADRGIPAILTLELTGGILPNGQVLFVSGLCEEVECQGIFLSILGEDTDKDGDMDRLDGEWAFGALLDTTVAALSGAITANAAR